MDFLEHRFLVPVLFDQLLEPRRRWGFLERRFVTQPVVVSNPLDGRTVGAKHVERTIGIRGESGEAKALRDKGQPQAVPAQHPSDAQLATRR